MTEQEIEAIAQRIFEESSEGTYKDWSREVRDRCLAAQIEAIKQKVRQLVDEIDFNTAHDREMRIHEDVIMGPHWEDPAAMTSEARRLLHCLRKPALPEPEPMSIEEHLAAYGAVKPRQAREPSGRGRRVPPPASVTRWVAAAGSGEGLRATMRRPDPWMPPASSAETRIAA